MTTTTTAQNTRTVTMAPIKNIHPNPYQPKTRVDVPEETARAFGTSILNTGMIQTPVCRRVNGANMYEMGDGWLRLQGHRWLVEQGHTAYQVIAVEVRELTDQQMADLVMEANTVRKDLNPIEEAELYSRYLADFKVTQAELAKRHNCSQGQVANTVRLLQLPSSVQEKVILREISPNHARQLLRLQRFPDLQERTADKCIKQGWPVSRLDEDIRYELWHRSKSLKADAPSWEEPPLFDPSACDGCEHVAKVAHAFAHEKAQPRCLDAKCWKKNDTARAELIRQQKEALKTEAGKTKKVFTSATLT